MELRLVEYRYRKLFGLTHEQYMNEPLGVVEWMLAIDNVSEGNAQT